MKATSLLNEIKSGSLDTTLVRLYGSARLEAQKVRYAEAVGEFVAIYGDLDVSVFSVPGRTEVSGNHTDHNKGCVLAAALGWYSLTLGEYEPDPMDCAVIGNEGHGMPDAMISECTACLRIPMAGHTESLNASAAAACILWEYHRARLGGK